MNSPIPKARQTDREAPAWRIEYDNDTGHDDGGFWEWWAVTDGERSFKANTEAEANWLLSTLSAPPPQEVRWVSVEERLPGEQGCDSEDVLCFLNGHCAITDNECRSGGGWGTKIGFFDAERQCFRVHGRPESFVTHWQPLPSAPKEQAA